MIADAPAPAGASRSFDGGFARRLDTPAGLAVMFAFALAFRLAIAPRMGFYGDLRLFQEWASRLRAVGPHRFYTPGQFADYPPGYLYVLWLIGRISAVPGYLLLKLPAVGADLGLAWVAGTMAARIAPQRLRERWPLRALVAAAVLFNPAVVALGAGWGQVDAVPAFFVLSSLLLLFTEEQSLRRELASFVLFAVAVAMKPQAGFVLPVMLYALYRRYLHARRPSELVDGLLSIGVVGTVSGAVWAVSGLAFGLGPVGLIHFYRQSASVYPVTSANAFNLWGAIGFWRYDQTGNHVVRVLGVPALYVGTFAFIAAVVLVLWRLHRAFNRGTNEGAALAVAAATISLLAYTLLTRMHERYMFLALACLAPLVFDRRLRWAYGALSVLFVLNLWYPYTYFNAEWGVQDFHVQPWFNWLFGGYATDTWQKTMWSAAVTAIAAGVAWVGLRWPGGTHAGARVRVLAATRLRVLASAPHAVVALACGFGLVTLRSETSPAENLNDSAFHLQMVRWASERIHHGRVPLDGWFPDFSLGSSFFHHYQSLSEMLTAYAAYITGASDQTTYLWIQYLLLALWPVSVYAGARLLGWERWTSSAAAAVSPLIVSAPGYGYEHGSYIWAGYGVYSQLWAMWLLPLAWGLTYRTVAHGRRYAAAAVALALTIACHFITGYFALLTVGVWVIVLGSGFARRVGRAAVLALGSLAVAAWVLVPLISDTTWTTQSEYYKGTIFNDSYGARKVLGWLVTGKLFDDGRFPIVSVLVLVGACVCVVRARADLRARALLGAFTLSMLLFFGRPTLGPVLDVLPGFGDVQVHRFVMGVHLAGILIAGVGLAWILRTAPTLARRIPAVTLPTRYAWAGGPLLLAACVGILAPAWTERASYDRHGAALIRAQRVADRTNGTAMDQLVSIVKSRGGGRVYAGLRSNWGHDYTVGYVPVYAWLADRDVDAIGFTFRTIASLSTDVEAAFDETNPAQYEMFDVRYLILPTYKQPPVPATLLASTGGNRLYGVNTTGYFQVVDRSAAIAANRTDIEQTTRSWRGSNLAADGIYPGIAFAGAAAPPPTFNGATPPSGAAGQVIDQQPQLDDGVFTATVSANRPAVVLLKASYDRRWTVTVDGIPDKPVMMAPSLVGVEVPTGRHVVRFRYRPYGHYALLFLIGVVGLLGFALFPRRAELRRFRPRRAPVAALAPAAPVLAPPARARELVAGYVGAAPKDRAMPPATAEAWRGAPEHDAIDGNGRIG